jgi:predicted nucleic acid binding AN1-type Zn finger protein
MYQVLGIRYLVRSRRSPFSAPRQTLLYSIFAATEVCHNLQEDDDSRPVTIKSLDGTGRGCKDGRRPGPCKCACGGVDTSTWHRKRRLLLLRASGNEALGDV